MEIIKSTARLLKPRNILYPFEDLEIGQSFILRNHAIKLASIRSAASAKGIKLHRKFKVAECVEDGTHIIEVGRIA